MSAMEQHGIIPLSWWILMEGKISVILYLGGPSHEIVEISSASVHAILYRFINPENSNQQFVF